MRGDAVVFFFFFLRASTSERDPENFWVELLFRALCEWSHMSALWRLLDEYCVGEAVVGAVLFYGVCEVSVTLVARWAVFMGIQDVSVTGFMISESRNGYYTIM